MITNPYTQAIPQATTLPAPQQGWRPQQPGSGNVANTPASPPTKNLGSREGGTINDDGILTGGGQWQNNAPATGNFPLPGLGSPTRPTPQRVEPPVSYDPREFAIKELMNQADNPYSNLAHQSAMRELQAQMQKALKISMRSASSRIGAAGLGRSTFGAQMLGGAISSPQDAYMQGVSSLLNSAQKRQQDALAALQGYTDIASKEGMQRQDIASREKSQGLDIAARRELTGMEIGSREKLQGQDIASRELMQRRDIGSREGIAYAQLSQADEQFASTHGLDRERLSQAKQQFEATHGQNFLIALMNNDVEATRVANDYDIGRGRLANDVTKNANDMAIAKMANDIASGRLKLDDQIASWQKGHEDKRIAMQNGMNEAQAEHMRQQDMIAAFGEHARVADAAIGRALQLRHETASANLENKRMMIEAGSPFIQAAAADSSIMGKASGIMPNKYTRTDTGVINGTVHPKTALDNARTAQQTADIMFKTMTVAIDPKTGKPPTNNKKETQRWWRSEGEYQQYKRLTEQAAYWEKVAMSGGSMASAGVAPAGIESNLQTEPSQQPQGQAQDQSTGQPMGGDYQRFLNNTQWFRDIAMSPVPGTGEVDFGNMLQSAYGLGRDVYTAAQPGGRPYYNVPSMNDQAMPPMSGGYGSYQGQAYAPPATNLPPPKQMQASGQPGASPVQYASAAPAVQNDVSSSALRPPARPSLPVLASAPRMPMNIPSPVTIPDVFANVEKLPAAPLKPIPGLSRPFTAEEIQSMLMSPLRGLGQISSFDPNDPTGTAPPVGDAFYGNLYNTMKPAIQASPRRTEAKAKPKQQKPAAAPRREVRPGDERYPTMQQPRSVEVYPGSPFYPVMRKR